MGVLILFLFVGALYVVVYKMFSSHKTLEEIDAEMNEKEKQRNLKLAKEIKEKEGLNYLRSISCHSVVGIKDCYSPCLFDDRLRFKNRKGETIDILFSCIESIEVMNDIQIQEKSKVGEMMVIGAFALATKKKTEEIYNTKISVNVNENGLKYSVILDTIYDALTEAKELNKLLIEYKSRV